MFAFSFNLKGKMGRGCVAGVGGEVWLFGMKFLFVCCCFVPVLDFRRQTV